MKKTLALLATTCFFAISFASNHVKKEKITITESELIQYCSISITFYDQYGLAYGFQIHSSDQATASDCQAFQNGWINYYKAQGYRISYGQTSPSTGT